jgi:hypothetical protein
MSGISMRFGILALASPMAFWMSWRFISRSPSGSLTSGRWISGREISGMAGSFRVMLDINRGPRTVTARPPDLAGELQAHRIRITPLR